MEIKKDSRYFCVYLICVILATLLSIGVVVFLIIMTLKEYTNIFLYLIPLFAIIGDLFAYNSFIGYIKTPEVILKITDDEVTFTPDKTRQEVTLKITDIKGVQVVRPLICRSGKSIIINTDEAKYMLEDINNINEPYDILVEKIKG